MNSLIFLDKFPRISSNLFQFLFYFSQFQFSHLRKKIKTLRNWTYVRQITELIVEFESLLCGRGLTVFILVINDS